jgi:hypothetical protein
MNVTAGTTTVNGGTTIGANGLLNISGGTFTANNNIVLNAGKLIHTSGGFNLGSGRSLSANTGAQVSFGSSYAIANGTTFTIQSGSSLSTASYLDVGATTNGTLTVTGPSSALNVATGFTISNADWGYNGGVANVTISNQATATINTPGLTIGSSTTAGSAGTVNVNTAATMSVKNLSIGTQSAGVGTLTVNGASSAVTQSGSSTLTIGASYTPGAPAPARSTSRTAACSPVAPALSRFRQAARSTTPVARSTPTATSALSTVALWRRARAR